MTINDVKLIELPKFADPRGNLSFVEQNNHIPFEIKRTFFIFDTTPGTVRGNHAHHRNRQMLICTSGACTIDCEMPDGTKSSHRLDWPDKGLLVEGMVWHQMKEFSKDAVLLVLASEHYDESDYVRSYEEFRRICSGREEVGK